MDALRGRVLAGDQEPELIHQPLSNKAVVIEIDDIFAVLKICAGLGKCQPAHVLVPDSAIGVEAANRNELIQATPILAAFWPPC